MAMEATVAERGQITLPKAVRDALGLTKGTLLKVELEGGRIILRKNVSDAISRARGRFKLPPGKTTDDIMRELRGRAPGDPLEPFEVMRDPAECERVAGAETDSDAGTAAKDVAGE
jgi:AbrB family looped-hinge helix DNA binding protein